MKNLMKTLLLLVTAWLAQASMAQVVVVVGAKSAASALTLEQAAGLYLGKTDQLPGVGVALLLDQPDAGSVREHFYTKVTGKSASQVKAAWSRLVFSGKATPPKELANDAEVKKFVAANPDAIGYIDKSAVDSTVKVVFTSD